jgi:hypothetical protein
LSRLLLPALGISCARRDLRRLDPQIRARVITSLERLTENPDKGGLRTLTGRPESRLRIGDTPCELLRSSPPHKGAQAGRCGPPCTLKGTGRGPLLACWIRENDARVIDVTRVLPRGRAYDR